MVRCLTSRSTDQLKIEIINAAFENDVLAARNVIARGGKLNVADYDRRTPMHLAASEGHLDMTRFLIAKGVNLNSTDRFGNTPLMDALAGKHTRTVALLKAAGALTAVNKKDRLEILSKSCVSGDILAINTILDCEVDMSIINKNNEGGRTPVHHAVAGNHRSAVELLLSRGADPHVTDLFGESALEMSKRLGYANVSKILENPKEVTVLAVRGPNETLQEEVMQIMRFDGDFSKRMITSEVDYYFNDLQLQPFYFHRFNAEEIASHIKAYHAAKRIARVRGETDKISFRVETAQGGFYLAPPLHKDMQKVETIIEARASQLAKGLPNSPTSLVYFLSQGQAIKGGASQVGMYILDASEFVNPNPEPGNANVEEIATKLFVEQKPPELKERYQTILNEVSNSQAPVLKRFEPYKDGTIPMMFGFRNERQQHNALASITDLIHANNLTVERKMVENFSNGCSVLSLYMHTPKEAMLQIMDDFVDQVGLLFVSPKSAIIGDKYQQGIISAREYAYAMVVKKFAFYFCQRENEALQLLLKKYENDADTTLQLNELKSHLSSNGVNEVKIAEAIAAYPAVVKQAYREFESSFHDDLEFTNEGSQLSISQSLLSKIESEVRSDDDLPLMRQFATFNASVLKTNFFKTHKSCLSFRLDPQFLAKNFKDIPYGMFMVCGSEYMGFHLRFSDVSRGGIRIVKSPSAAAYARNADRLFDECYGLAWTQNKKNKDLPEFGSKGTVLISSPEAQDNPASCFRSYIDGLLDLILPDARVLDRHGKEEILFLGPDENTADLMEWAALHAKKRGYAYWQGFTTGKPTTLGGIPHDVYGMTTRSVHKYVTETLTLHNIREEDVTKLQTGGPDGDLGSNEILISKDKTIAIIDGSGVIYDPSGLDRPSITQLAKDRSMVTAFPDEMLGEGAFKVSVNDTDVTLPTGEIVRSGMQFRNEFHLHPMTSADLFVPCGGRPESVNASNVHQLLPDSGTPRFRYIVEGANLFFTPEARKILESAGVVLFKDASTNKGGVTSSSLEVLNSLVLTDEEYERHVCFDKESEEPPQFYQEYIKEIIARVENNAVLECRCLNQEHERTSLHRNILTDVLSDKINEINVGISHSSFYDDIDFRRKVLSLSIPMRLQELVGGIDEVLKRLPENYVRAEFARYLSSQYVYTHGIAANELDFCAFMNKLQAQQ